MELNTLSTVSLLNLLASHIINGPYNEELSHFIFLVMHSMHMVNQPHPYWQDDETLEMPVIEYDIDGLIKRILTPKKVNYVKLFEFIYKVFLGELKPNLDDSNNQIREIKRKLIK